MATANTIRRLPRNPKDGDAVADRYGNLWEYSGEINAWIDRGTINDPPDVDETRPGLVTPSVFKKLQRLRSLYQQDPASFQPLKLAPGSLAYWYYLRSADKLFKFTPEGESGLRIEIDRGRLYQILRKQVCPGPKGPRGDQGDPGPDGDAGAVEACWSPSAVEGDRLDFAIFVPTPIRTPISLRIHRATPIDTGLSIQALSSSPDHLSWWSEFLKRSGFTNQLGVVERQFQRLREVGSARANRLTKMALPDSPCNITLGDPLRGDVDPLMSAELTIDPFTPSATTYNQPVPALALDQTRTNAALVYDQETRVLCGSLYLASGTWGSESDWCLKARQVGPDGPDGPDGQCAISIVECEITDSPILGTCPVISIRADCEEEVLYWLCSELVSERCVERLQLAAGSGGIAQDDAMVATFGAAQVTTEQCKRVYRYRVELPDDESPVLDLAHWEPQPGCVSKRNFDRHKFDWIPDTDLPACNAEGVRWYGPDALNPTKFPWAPIVEQPPEEDQCCADDMFYCPNAQEDLCAPIPPPIIIPPADGGDGGDGGDDDGDEEEPGTVCIELHLLDSSDKVVGKVNLTKTVDNWNYASMARLTGGAWRGCATVPVKGSPTSVPSGSTPPPTPVCCVNVPVTFELGNQFDKWTLAMSCPVVPLIPREVPTSDRNAASLTGTWDCSNYSPPTYSEAPDSHPWIGLSQAPSQVTFDLNNPAKLVGTVFTVPTTGLGANLGVGYRKVRVVDCSPTAPPTGPPPPPSGAVCYALKLESSDGLTVTIPISKVSDHYTWGADLAYPGPSGLNPPSGTAWRGCVMLPVWGSDTANNRPCGPPNPAFDGNPRNISVPMVVEIMNYVAPPDQEGKGKLVCWMGVPVCTTIPNNGVPTNLKSQCGQGQGDWNCSNFSPSRNNITGGNNTPKYCGYVTSFMPGPNHDFTDQYSDIEDIEGRVFEANAGTVGTQYLFGTNMTARPTKLTVIRLSDCNAAPPPPPVPPPPTPPGPPPPPAPPQCCVERGFYTIQPDSYGPALVMEQYAGGQRARRILSKSGPGCQIPLVNRAVDYRLTCSGTSVTLFRSYACCGETVIEQSKTIPFALNLLGFSFTAKTGGTCMMPAEIVTIKGNCASATPPPAPPDGSGTPPAPPAPPPSSGPDQYGCTDNKQPCGQILFTGSANSGKNKANTIIIRDPLGDTALQPLTMGGVSIWRGCSMRTVPQAWVGVSSGGTGGTLQSNVKVPIAYDLYCYPYPGGFGRPTPSPATSYPTGPPSGGFYLRMFWPIRANGEVIPAASRVSPDITFGCSTCVPGGACPPGSIQGDWLYPNSMFQTSAQASVCGSRPMTVAFELHGLVPIFGSDVQTVQAIEQNYNGPPSGLGPQTLRFPDGFDIPIVRI